MKNDFYNFQHPEPFKKHLLNQFVHEQQQQQQKNVKNETVVYRSSFESDGKFKENTFISVLGYLQVSRR